MKIAALVVLAGVSISACDLIGVESCDDETVPGINVVALDSITGDTLRGVKITVTAREGSYVETVETTPAATEYVFPVALARERPGTYTLQVTAPGNLEWTQVDLRVDSEGCHARTVVVGPRLRRQVS